jgi:uncharacterized damage-inducible protein DinB
MSDVTAVDLVRGLYDYHWWANRQLFDVTAGLGQALADREVGPQFSFPTVQRMLNHLYGGDAIWLSRWQGHSPSSVPGADIPTLAILQERWDTVESEQRAFLAALRPDDLGRTVDYKTTDGRQFRMALWPLLQHVANHATHHRSEVATMLTMLSGSPPDTGVATYRLLVSGQGA